MSGVALAEALAKAHVERDKAQAEAARLRELLREWAEASTNTGASRYLDACRAIYAELGMLKPV